MVTVNRAGNKTTMKLQSSTFILLMVTVSAYAVLQEVTFYTESGYQGDGIVFRSHWNNFTGIDIITKNSKSKCGVGYWVMCSGANFENPCYWASSQAGTSCANSVQIQVTNSIRHLAAPNMTTPAISLYSNTGYGGVEYYVQSVAGAYIPFTPKSFATSGSSSWTFFTGPNFDGNSTCRPAGTGLVSYVTGEVSTGVVQSVVRGCGAEAVLNLKQHLLATRE